jgi:hypothetical protein
MYVIAALEKNSVQRLHCYEKMKVYGGAGSKGFFEFLQQCIEPRKLEGSFEKLA